MGEEKRRRDGNVEKAREMERVRKRETERVKVYGERGRESK